MRVLPRPARLAGWIPTTLTERTLYDLEQTSAERIIPPLTVTNMIKLTHFLWQILGRISAVAYSKMSHNWISYRLLIWVLLQTNPPVNKMAVKQSILGRQLIIKYWYNLPHITNSTPYNQSIFAQDWIWNSFHVSSVRALFSFFSFSLNEAGNWTTIGFVSNKPFKQLLGLSDRGQ